MKARQERQRRGARAEEREGSARLAPLARPALRSPGLLRQRPRRSAGSLGAAVALHVVLVAALAQILIVPDRLHRLIGRGAAPGQEPERVVYTTLSRAGSPTVEARAGGDGQRGTAERSAALRAPAAVPAGIPAASPDSGGPATQRGGTGQVIGGGGPTRGIVPGYGDPSLWQPVIPAPAEPKTSVQRLDSALTSSLRAYQDSLARIAAGEPKRKPGDWTFERNGKKYGWDDEAIRLGDVSIPNAVLALLPLNIQKHLSANPIAYERERQRSSMRLEINEQAQRSMNEAEFRDAVRNLRERRERERRRRSAEGNGPAAVPGDTVNRPR